jgi:hypothetical protein
MDNQTNSPLPPLYARWFNDLLGGDIPSESRATCSDCAMCESTTEPQPHNSRFYNPQSKCCTYLPMLPNFLVGMILTDDDPSMAGGRATVEARLQAGLAVTPRGLEWPLKGRAQYTQMEVRAFGRAQSLRCPHYLSEQGGLCGIWKYRNSVCSTWFCKYVRGAVGRNFWESVKHLLLAIEDELSQWCALQLELTDSALEFLLAPKLMPEQQPRFTLEDLDEKVDLEQQRRIWGNWYGREPEFYRACGELIAPLCWSKVQTICGTKVQVQARLAQQAYGLSLVDEIPERLRMGSFSVTEASRGFFNLYHPAIGMDTVPLSERVMKLLPYFDGRSTTEIVNQIVEREGLRFTDELLRRLVDFKILVPAEG